MINYNTVAGDTWDYIALKILGSERYTSALMEANTKYIDTVIFNAGIELNIPVIETVKTPKLPPWKR